MSDTADRKTVVFINTVARWINTSDTKLQSKCVIGTLRGGPIIPNTIFTVKGSFQIPLRWKRPLDSKPASDDVEPLLMAAFRAVNSPPLLVGNLQPAGQILVVGIVTGVLALAQAAVF